MTDQPRSGRRLVISPAILSKVSKLAINKHTGKVFSATKLSELLQQDFGVSASLSTIRRRFRALGWKYGTAKRVLMLKAEHKQKRLAFAHKHLSSKTSFSSWLFTDSKLFLLQKTSAKAGARIWYPRGGRPSVPVVKQSQGVHVYLGVTKFGATKPIFVTGGGTQKSVHVNPKTGQPFSGVSAVEYQEQVLPSLIRDANKLFSSSGTWASRWLFQQDNARPHIAKTTQVLLHKLLPERVVDDWPPMSPDLSWIENIWAWAQGQLDKHYTNMQTQDELKSALTEVLGSIPRELLENHVHGMPGRLDRVVSQKGGPIG